MFKAIEIDITDLWSRGSLITGDTVQIASIPAGSTLTHVQYPYSRLRDRRIYCGVSYSIPGSENITFRVATREEYREAFWPEEKITIRL